WIRQHYQPKSRTTRRLVAEPGKWHAFDDGVCHRSLNSLHSPATDTGTTQHSIRSQLPPPRCGALSGQSVLDMMRVAPFPPIQGGRVLNTGVDPHPRCECISGRCAAAMRVGHWYFNVFMRSPRLALSAPFS